VTSNRWAAPAYWLVVVMLFAAQAGYTLSGLERLGYEELAEGIRNPFWLEHRLVYDGVSSNVGWYGLLLLVYKVAGFSAYTAKFVRLAFHLLFLASSALLLKRWLGLPRAFLPLLAVGLSPTALYFNNLETSYGTDIQLSAAVLFLIASLAERPPEGPRRRALLAAAAGALTMVACLMFPSFLVYVPLLLVAFVWMAQRADAQRRLGKDVTWLTAGFCAPFAVAVLFVRNRSVLLFDAAAGGAGVFRGGGGALTTDPVDITRSIGAVFHDLFVRGNSYYFSLQHTEFSGLLGVMAAWGMLAGALVVAWNWKASRVPLALAGTLCLLSICVPALSRHLPGLRRSTGVIAGVYVILACMWAAPVPAGLRALAVWAGKIACLLLLVHHLIVYVPNARDLQASAQQVHDPWFHRFGSPSESIAAWAHDVVLRGKPLTCESSPDNCRFAEIYAAVSGYLKWNGLGEPPVTGVDPKSSAVIPLDIHRSRQP
jgi:hypothetical protein